MDKTSSERWYFTFPMKNAELGFKYVKFEGTYGEARTKMVEAFGTHWAFQYDEESFLPQIAEFGLSELVL